MFDVAVRLEDMNSRLGLRYGARVKVSGEPNEYIIKEIYPWCVKLVDKRTGKVRCPSKNSFVCGDAKML